MNRSRAIVAVAVAGLALLLGACAPASDSADSPQQPAPPTERPPQAAPKPPRAILGDGFAIRLELALTREEITQGLMFRPSLADNRGMLFLFEAERVPSFWMKNMMIPLDLLFLDGQGTIVDIVANAQPCAIDPCPQYVPARAVSAVLEVSAGTAERHRLAAGDRIDFRRVPGYPK